MGYGQFSVAYNWITYFQVLVEYGYTLNGARKIAISKDSSEENRLWRSIVCSRAVLFFFSLIILNLFYIINRDPVRHKNMMILMLIVLSVVFQMNWLFQGKQEMKFITIVNLTGRISSMILIFLFVKKSDHVSLYCFLYAFTFLVSSFLGLFVAVHRFNIHPSFASISEIVNELRDGWVLFTSNAIARVFGSVGITILGIFANIEIVGAYSAIYKIPYILNMCFSPISQALFPYLSQCYSESYEKAISLVKKLMLSVVGLFGIICVLIVILRRTLISLLFGVEFTKYSNIILLLCPQSLLGIINNFLGIQTLVAMGYKEYYSKCILYSTLILVLLNFLLCPYFQLYGTALSSLITEATLSIMLLFILKKRVLKKSE